LIKYIQISIFLLAAIYGSEPIVHSVSLEYSVTEKFKLFSLKDIISIKIEGKDIEIKPEGFGTSILDESLKYNNQDLSDSNLLYMLLVNKIVPSVEDKWIDSFFLLDSLAIKARFLFSEEVDGKRVYRLDIIKLNKEDIDNRVNVVILDNDVIEVWTDKNKSITKIRLMYKNASYVIDVKNEK
jgi:hypothetical protein